VALIVVFGLAPLIAVPLSGPAARSVLSDSLLFPVGGALMSDGFLGLIHITPHSDIVGVTADLALFVVLFTDGMHVTASAPESSARSRLPTCWTTSWECP
jgi:sodium/hydrogen antiporter